MTIRTLALASTLLTLIAIAAIHPNLANADKQADRLDPLPLNTNSLRVRPATGTLISTPRVSWWYCKRVTTASATLTLTVTGAVTGDIVNATLGSATTNAVYIRSAIAGTDAVVVTLSGAAGGSAFPIVALDVKRTL